MISASPRLALAALGMIVVAAVAYWAIPSREAPAKSSGGSAVPVSAVEVERRDVPHRISSIGTVQSLHTVVVRPQVTGQVMEVLFKEGDLVQRGALLARIDDRSIRAALAQAEAQKTSSEAELRIAELDMSRYSGLRDRSVIPRQTIDQQAALVEQLKATIVASEATIAAQRVQLSFTQITSPVSGRVGIRRVDPGNLVQAGDAQGLVTITQLHPISILFTLPQAMLSEVQRASARNGEAAQVTAFDRDNGSQIAQGKLTTVEKQIDSTSGTFRLRAEFANPEEQLWPGQFVTLELRTGMDNAALVVPSRSVQQGLNGAFVYRVRDEKAELASVVTRYQDDEIAVIESGLDTGDLVVVDGQSRLKAGSKVKVSQPAAGGSNVTGP